MGGHDQKNPPASFDDEDEHTVMVPTFSDGSFFADRYRVEKLLGTGAMGRVYAAVELHSDRRVALKVLHKERLGEEETVQRFRREAEVLASIGHPCIVEIYTFHHTSDGTPYLAMELLEGVTLKTRLQNAGRFQSATDFQEVLDGICGALEAAHARGIVHRDMKPDNVFLLATGDPRAKLVDFGLSRMAKADKSLTHSGMILGTPRYMAPEQIRDAASAGPGGDIYSLGVMIHESLSGQSPYPAQDYGQLLGCVLENRITPLSQARPDLPPALAEVIKKAMAYEVAERFQSCGELAEAYAAAIGSPSRMAEIAARQRPKPKRRERSISLAALPMNKGSTLAFDVAAMGVPEAKETPPANRPGPAADDEDEPTALWNEASNPTNPDPPRGGGAGAGASMPGGGGTTPMASWSNPAASGPAAGGPASSGAATSGPAAGGAPGGAPPSNQSFPSVSSVAPPAASPGGSSPGSSSPGWSPGGASPGGSSPGPSPEAGGSAQGGDTVMLSSAEGMPGFVGGPYSPSDQAPSPYGASPQPSPGMSASAMSGSGMSASGVSSAGMAGPSAPYASGPGSMHPAGMPSQYPPPAAPPKKKSRLGLVLFLLALIVVVVVSAVGGFALRAHMRGELELPFEVPGQP